MWCRKLSSKKNNYQKYTQIYTFLGNFRLPLWLFHKLKGDNQIFIHMKYVLFMIYIKILMLTTSNNTGKCTFGLKHHSNVAKFLHIKDIWTYLGQNNKFFDFLS